MSRRFADMRRTRGDATHPVVTGVILTCMLIVFFAAGVLLVHLVATR